MHKGKRFLFCDFANYGRDAASLREEVEEVDAAILAEPKGSVLALADLRGTVTSSAVVDLFKQSAKRTHGWVERQAVVGVTGIQKILASAVARFSGQSMHLFDTVDEAKEWLAGASSGGVEISTQDR